METVLIILSVLGFVLGNKTQQPIYYHPQYQYQQPVYYYPQYPQQYYTPPQAQYYYHK